MSNSTVLCTWCSKGAIKIFLKRDRFLLNKCQTLNHEKWI